MQVSRRTAHGKAGGRASEAKVACCCVLLLVRALRLSCAALLAAGPAEGCCLATDVIPQGRQKHCSS